MFPISVITHLFLTTTTMSAAVSAAAAAPTIGALPLTTSTQNDSTGTNDPSTSSPLLPPPSPLTSKPLQIGDTLCLEGSVMDLRCHRRDPSVETHLFDPELPSIRSLLDVDRCIRSGYELLLDLDSPSHAATTTIATTTAAASETNNNNATTTTTTNDNNDDDIHNHHHQHTKRKDTPRTIRIRLDPIDISPLQTPVPLSDHSTHSSDVPFRITVNGTVTHLGDHDDSTPFTLRTFQITHSSAICPSHEAVVNSSNGDNDYTKMVFWHGSLMIVGWGWMLPSGVIVARFGKHREGALWFRLHRVLQSLGLAVALVAWIMALVKFHVFGRDIGGGGGEGKAYYHGVVGIIIMTLGFIQPMIAFVRPPNEEDIFVGGVKSTARIVWEGVHKSVGYLAILLAVGNIVVGTTLVPMMADRRKFQLGYGIGAVGAVVILMVALLVDRWRWRKRVLEERKENRPSFLGPLLGNEDLVPL